MGLSSLRRGATVVELIFGLGYLPFRYPFDFEVDLTSRKRRPHGLLNRSLSFSPNTSRDRTRSVGDWRCTYVEQSRLSFVASDGWIRPA